MTKFQTCVQILVASSKMEEETKSKKESAIPRAGIEPATFRLYVSITAERHIQLDHRGLTCDSRRESMTHESVLFELRSKPSK